MCQELPEDPPNCQRQSFYQWGQEELYLARLVLGAKIVVAEGWRQEVGHEEQCSQFGFGIGQPYHGIICKE